MNISIIGTGYVGLVSGACFADLGNNVICVDVDEKKIANLKKCIIPIYEPGLEELIIKNYKSSRLNFTTNLKYAINHSDIVFICVGTPTKKKTYAAWVLLNSPTGFQTTLILVFFDHLAAMQKGKKKPTYFGCPIIGHGGG